MERGTFPHLMLSFDGRIARGEYVVGIGLCLLLYALWAVLSVLQPVAVWGYFVFAPVVTWCAIAVQAKRMHDIGRSGWWILVPFAAWLLFFIRGDREENRFGLPPSVDVGEDYERRYVSQSSSRRSELKDDPRTVDLVDRLRRGR